MRRRESIDKLIKDGLRQSRYSYPQGAWEEFARQYGNELPKGRNNRTKKALVLSLLILIGSGMSWMFLNRPSDEVNKAMAVTAPSVPKTANSNDLGREAYIELKDSGIPALPKGENLALQKVRIARNASHSVSPSASSEVTAASFRTKYQPVTFISSAIEMVEAAPAISTEASLLAFDHDNTSSRRNPKATETSWLPVLVSFMKNPAFTGQASRLYASAENNQVWTGSNSAGPMNTELTASANTRFGNFGVAAQLKQFALSNTYNLGLAYSHKLFDLAGGELRGGLGLYRFTREVDEKSLFYPTSTVERSARFRKSSYAYLHAQSGVWYQRAQTRLGVTVGKDISVNHRTDALPEAVSVSLLATTRARLSQALSLEPLAELHLSKPIAKADINALVVYKDRIMTGFGYRNISLGSLSGDLVVYGGLRVKERLQLYSSYGQSLAWSKSGVDRHLIQLGINLQIP